jgi:hypothetical protein
MPKNNDDWRDAFWQGLGLVVGALLVLFIAYEFVTHIFGSILDSFVP